MSLPPETRMGSVMLGVSNLQRSVDFYTKVIGLFEIARQDHYAALGVGSTPLLYLKEIQNAQRQPNFTTGLYHVAILLPSRPDLGRVLLNLAQMKYPIQGMGDHYVSEAIYLADPDGNGLELYRDRPREEWQWNGDQVVMGTVEVDVEAVIASVPDQNAPFKGMPAGTTIGHVHLRVGDIPKAQAFYRDVIGFDVVSQWNSALFVSAGRYHHHLGMNTWQSHNAPPPPENSVGLQQYNIIVPDTHALTDLSHRLEQANIAYRRENERLLVDDPWHNHIAIIIE